jgi:hypothetical protein
MGFVLDGLEFRQVPFLFQSAPACFLFDTFPFSGGLQPGLFQATSFFLGPQASFLFSSQTRFFFSQTARDLFSF